MKNKKKSGNTIYTIIILLLLAVIGFCLYKIVPYFWNNYQTAGDYEQLRVSYITTDSDVDSNGEESVSTESVADYLKVKIDFDALRKENSDIVGWLRFDNTDEIAIDYPVLHRTNDAYIHTDIYGKYSFSGCLFIEENNQPDIDEEQNVIVYGHNMYNGSMFGTLKKYRQQDIYDENSYFTYYTSDKVYRYQIFSYFLTQDTSFVYQTGFGEDEAYEAYLKQLSDASQISTGITPSMEDKVMILSTCTSGSETSTERFVVVGVLVEETEIK